MSLFVKSISLMLSTILLIACGSSSSNSNKPKPYSLDDYRGRMVSSDSLAGTWVSVSEWQYFQYGNEVHRDYFVSKKYFLITGVEGEYAMSSCDNGYSDLLINDYSPYSFSDTTIENQYFSTSESEEVNFDGRNYLNFRSFEMIKISDNTDNLGLLELKGDYWAGTELAVNCFRQGFWNSQVVGDNERYFIQENYSTGLEDNSVVKSVQYSGAWIGTIVDIFGLSFSESGTSINVNSQSSTAHSIAIVGSHGLEDMLMKGNINIQLPSQ